MIVLLTLVVLVGVAILVACVFIMYNVKRNVTHMKRKLHRMDKRVRQDVGEHDDIKRDVDTAWMAVDDLDKALVATRSEVRSEVGFLKRDFATLRESNSRLVAMINELRGSLDRLSDEYVVSSNSIASLAYRLDALAQEAANGAEVDAAFLSIRSEISNIRAETTADASARAAADARVAADAASAAQSATAAAASAAEATKAVSDVKAAVDAAETATAAAAVATKSAADAKAAAEDAASVAAKAAADAKSAATAAAEAIASNAQNASDIKAAADAASAVQSKALANANAAAESAAAAAASAKTASAAAASATSSATSATSSATSATSSATSAAKSATAAAASVRSPAPAPPPPTRVPTGYAMLMIAGAGQAQSGSIIVQWESVKPNLSGAIFKPVAGSVAPTYSITGGGRSGKLPFVAFNAKNYLKNSSGQFNVDVATGKGLTLLAYVRFPALQTGSPRILHGAGVGGSIELIRTNTNLTASSQQLNNASVTGNNYAPTNQWMMVAMRYSNATKKLQLFKDSVATSTSVTPTGTGALATKIAHGNNVAIGCMANDGSQKAQMDLNFMALYPRPLTDAELSAFFSAATFANGVMP